MTPDQQTVINIREYLSLHYETKKRLAEHAEDNFERVRMGLSELPYFAEESTNPEKTSQ